MAIPSRLNHYFCVQQCKNQNHSHKIDSAHTYSKNHMSYSNNDGQLHFKGVQENDLVAGQLKNVCFKVSEYRRVYF